MKSLLLLSACGLALTSLSACAPMTSPAARVALDCPSNQGDLKLSSMAPDKTSCIYSTSDGDQVSLRLLAVSGNYQATLQPIEQELQSEISLEAKAGDAKAGDAKTTVSTGDKTVKVTATVSSTSAASKAASEAANDAKGAVSKGKKGDDDEDGKIDVKSGDGNGEHAHIDLPGIHINADDKNANVNVGGINVDAGENGATVRMSRDVRLRGQAFSSHRNGFRSTYILARDDLKDGWRSVGYEAAGPKTGPITVAVFKAHEGGHREVSDDVKRLVRRNGGV